MIVKGRVARLYWSALNVSRRAKDYPDRLVALPKNATEAEVEDLCRMYTARLDLWLDHGPEDRWHYDGTVGSLCDCFERHPESPIHEVRRTTARSYRESLKILRATVGKRAIRAVAPLEVKRWFREWRAPKVEGGEERPKRAHDAVAALRMILRFGVSMKKTECRDLVDGLAKMQFEKSGARESVMTVDHARAFIKTALARGDERGLYMAIGLATQFETMLRQGDVIGEWSRDEKTRREVWIGSYRWENIQDGILRVRTSKSNSTKLVVHDLKRLDLLWPLIQRVPQSERHGAVIKDRGEPVRETSYRKWFREIARAAEIPGDVWSMDARSGGITEALEAGAKMSDVSRTATHSNPQMTMRYDRTAESSPAAVAQARKNARARKGNEP